MIFNSFTFLCFIAVFFPLYFILRGKQRILLSLFASYIFYGWWDWRFLGLLITSTVIDYSLGLQMGKSPTEQHRRKLLLLSVFINLGILGFFKYFNFFIDSFDVLLTSAGINFPLSTLQIILPVGISFYTFQSMSYTIDIYRKEIEVEYDFWRFATYVAFFPQLVAGPIVRARDFLPQLQKDHAFDWQQLNWGVGLMLWGFFKKVAVADSLAPFVDQCFQTPEAFSSFHLLTGVIFYSFQIYCDFSGYSDIAIGVAMIFGFYFPVNFKTPYFSQNFSEFWTRWHITLSTWLRDYLYIPLGGNRRGVLQTYRNLMLTMLLGGLWHGANWTFVFWGFLHGFYLVVQRLAGKSYTALLQNLKVPTFASAGMNILIVYSLTCFAWIFFRSGNFQTAIHVITGIGSLENFTPGSIVNKFVFIKGILLIGILLSVEVTNFKFHFLGLASKSTVFRIAAYASLLWIISLLGTFGSNAFIYFQF